MVWKFVQSGGGDAHGGPCSCPDGLVPVSGVEPPRPCGHEILSLARMPISPHRALAFDDLSRVATLVQVSRDVRRKHHRDGMGAGLGGRDVLLPDVREGRGQGCAWTPVSLLVQGDGMNVHRRVKHDPSVPYNEGVGSGHRSGLAWI
jgi:hypothetical protein